MHSRLFFVQLRHAHCTTNYLTEEKSTKWDIHTLRSNVIKLLQHLNVYFITHDIVCTQLTCGATRDVVHI